MSALLEAPAFMLEHKRLPRLGDDPPPWKYRGWLLPYVQGLHFENPACNRWGYYLRTLEAGRLLDEPIPPIRFDAPDRRVYAALGKWLALAGGGWSDFRSLIDWLSWGLALSREEPRIDRADGPEKLYRTVDLGLLLKAPHDYLGQWIAENHGRGWNPNAFFPTPHNVVECMVRMMFGDAEPEGRDTRLLSVLDPCVGTGRMLLHASNYSLNLWGQDIDPLVCAVCKINGVLYAPWLAFPFPAEIVPPPPPAPIAPPRVRKPAGVLFADW